MAASTSAASYSFLGTLTGDKIEKVNRESDGEGVEGVSEGYLEEERADGGRYLIYVSDNTHRPLFNYNVTINDVTSPDQSPKFPRAPLHMGRTQSCFHTDNLYYSSRQVLNSRPFSLTFF